LVLSAVLFLSAVWEVLDESFTTKIQYRYEIYLQPMKYGYVDTAILKIIKHKTRK